MEHRGCAVHEEGDAGNKAIVISSTNTPSPGLSRRRARGTDPESRAAVLNTRRRHRRPTSRRRGHNTTAESRDGAGISPHTESGGRANTLAYRSQA